MTEELYEKGPYEKWQGGDMNLPIKTTTFGKLVFSMQTGPNIHQNCKVLGSKNYLRK